MTDFRGSLRPPRSASAPASPVVGEMYYNTGSNKLFWWNGTAWVEAGGGGGGTAEVNVSTAGPSPRVGELLWVDTDEPSIGAGGVVPIEPWHTVGGSGEPGFIAPWVQNASYPLQFRKRPDGIVEIRGLTRGGTGASPIFVLPVGYRPVGQDDVLFPVTYSIGGVISADRAHVQTASGWVTANKGAPGAGDYVTFNVMFSTDQATFPTGPQGIPGPPGSHLSTIVSDAGQAANVLVNMPASTSEISRMMSAGSDWRISYTPPVDCWWEFSYRIPQLSKSVSNWDYFILSVMLADSAIPATTPGPGGEFTWSVPVGGEIARGMTTGYGPGGPPFAASLEAKRIVPLTAGLKYTLRPVISYTLTGGGNWQCQLGNTHNPQGYARAWVR